MTSHRPSERRTHSAAETEAAGAALAIGLRPGDVVLVSGDLGAGKTTFVRGALAALGVRDLVTSPTFVLGRLYDGTAGPVAHLDLYRLAGLEPEDPGLLEPYFSPGTVTFVEWPEQAGDDEAAAGGRPAAHHVSLEHAGGDARRLVIA